MELNSEFVKLKFSLDTKVIGKSYPQIQNLPVDYDEEGERSIYNFDFIGFSSLKPNLNDLPLQSNSIITDLLSCTYLSRGLLISKKLKELFENFNLPVNRFYPCSVILNGSNFEYFWFYFVSDLSVHIDYSSSEFYIGRNIKLRTQEFKFKNVEEYHLELENQKSKRQLLKPLKVKFKDSIELDIFTILPHDISNIYISKKLAKKLNVENISGYEIVDSLLF